MWRTPHGPVPTRSIIDRIMGAEGLNPDDIRTRSCIQKTILATLGKLEVVEKVDLGANEAAWRVVK